MHEVDVLTRLPRSRYVSQLEAPLRRDVFETSEDQRSVGRSSSVYKALSRHLSGWDGSGIGR